MHSGESYTSWLVGTPVQGIKRPQHWQLAVCLHSTKSGYDTRSTVCAVKRQPRRFVYCYDFWMLKDDARFRQ